MLKFIHIKIPPDKWYGKVYPPGLNLVDLRITMSSKLGMSISEKNLCPMNFQYGYMNFRCVNFYPPFIFRLNMNFHFSKK